MGTYVTFFVEKKDEKGRWFWEDMHEEWGNQSYILFEFLCGVRARSGIPRLYQLHRGLPPNVSNSLKHNFESDENNSSPSYVTVKELLEVDYDVTFFDTYEMKETTIREALGEKYFTGLEVLKNKYPEERLVFWFD